MARRLQCMQASCHMQGPCQDLYLGKIYSPQGCLKAIGTDLATQGTAMISSRSFELSFELSFQVLFSSQ